MTPNATLQFQFRGKKEKGSAEEQDDLEQAAKDKSAVFVRTLSEDQFDAEIIARHELCFAHCCSRGALIVMLMLVHGESYRVVRWGSGVLPRPRPIRLGLR